MGYLPACLLVLLLMGSLFCLQQVAAVQLQLRASMGMGKTKEGESFVRSALEYTNLCIRNRSIRLQVNEGWGHVLSVPLFAPSPALKMPSAPLLHCPVHNIHLKMSSLPGTGSANSKLWRSTQCSNAYLLCLDLLADLTEAISYSVSFLMCT